jgi:hypothetical protein
LGYSESDSVDEGVVTKVGCKFVKANLATPEGTVGRGEEVREVFLAERMRRALQKLTPEEWWLFNTHLRDGPFNDMLRSQEQIAAEMKGERPVLALTTGATSDQQERGAPGKEKGKRNRSVASRLGRRARGKGEGQSRTVRRVRGVEKGGCLRLGPFISTVYACRSGMGAVAQQCMPVGEVWGQ